MQGNFPLQEKRVASWKCARATNAKQTSLVTEKFGGTRQVYEVNTNEGENLSAQPTLFDPTVVLKVKTFVSVPLYFSHKFSHLVEKSL